MQDGKFRIRTYRQVWQLEHVIYQIERVRLPFPVTFRRIGLFVAALLLMLALSRLPPVDRLSPVLRYALVPGLVAWFLTSKRLDGKPPHRWVLSMLTYLLGPRQLNRMRPLPRAQGLRLTATLTYRSAPSDPVQR